ncbi:pyridoxamine 5'-phosphate oxidase family protein [Stappia stellulata]|uniref:pyridoxamine 5'-phosphate oxidase family protein n=1 Tax=Stappia stellulata TaxID=71235 RepID=UPI000490D89C|nr:pyridoxamine 5'-phosphate oxidase family protein [Stappia stellulata]
MTTIGSMDELEALYGPTVEAATVKEIDHVSDAYARLIAASPFVALATSGPEGLDCSPRGDAGAVVRIETPRRLALPDRRGNNRIDSLRNILRDPRVALLFLIPGSGTTLRVNGQASISVDKELLASFAVDGKAPRSVILVDVERVYFQCARAIVRSRLWEAETRRDPADLPTPGEILSELSETRVGGASYDAAWPERARKTLW